LFIEGWDQDGSGQTAETMSGVATGPRKVKEFSNSGALPFLAPIVEGFSKIAAPMNKYYGEGSGVEWKEEKQAEGV